MALALKLIHCDSRSVYLPNIFWKSIHYSSGRICVEKPHRSRNQSAKHRIMQFLWGTNTNGIKRHRSTEKSNRFTFECLLLWKRHFTIKLRDNTTLIWRQWIKLLRWYHVWSCTFRYSMWMNVLVYHRNGCRRLWMDHRLEHFVMPIIYFSRAFAFLLARSCKTID